MLRAGAGGPTTAGPGRSCTRGLHMQNGCLLRGLMEGGEVEPERAAAGPATGAAAPDGPAEGPVLLEAPVCPLLALLLPDVLLLSTWAISGSLPRTPACCSCRAAPAWQTGHSHHCQPLRPDTEAPNVHAIANPRNKHHLKWCPWLPSRHPLTKGQARQEQDDEPFAVQCLRHVRCPPPPASHMCVQARKSEPPVMKHLDAHADNQRARNRTRSASQAEISSTPYDT